MWHIVCHSSMNWTEAAAAAAERRFAVGNCWGRFAIQLSSWQANQMTESNRPHAHATHIERLLRLSWKCDVNVSESVCMRKKNDVLTAMRKSPGRSPAISATPPGSTSSKYCKPGQRSDGFSCISGDAAFAPRNTNPKPLLARWRTTFRDSMIPLKAQKENEKWTSKMSLSFPPLPSHVNA